MASASCSKSSNFTSMRFPLRDANFVGLVFVVELRVSRQDILHDFFLRDVLQFEGLNGIGEEGTRGFKYGVWISHQVDKLCIWEHLHQLLYAARVGRVLGEKLRAAGVPKGNF